MIRDDQAFETKDQIRSAGSQRFAPFSRSSSLTVRLVLCAALLLLVALFYVFSYNSGYGYDALEYLVIGRQIAKGSAFYSFIPSKSPGIYFLVAGFFSLGVPQTHFGVSAIITLLFTLSLIGTWMTTRHLFNQQVAMISTLLVAACAAFMEMNYLEPESVVFISGLMAFVLVLRSGMRERIWPLFWAGLSLAFGFQFKSVAAFYGLGIVGFFVVDHFRGRGTKLLLLRRGLLLASGFLIGIGFVFIVFAILGSASDYFLWTIKFPLLYYPANTAWIDRLYTKLFWFHLLLLTAFLYSLTAHSRKVVWRDDRAVLAFLMGLFSYLALLKTQASHYCFPGAAFFSIFIAAVVVSSPSSVRLLAFNSKARALTVAATLLVIGSSVALYRLDAARRLMEWRDFREEAVLESAITRHIEPGQKALFVKNASLLHWLSDTVPASRSLGFDVQTSYYVKHNPLSLLAALRDPETRLVEFTATDPGFEDAGFDSLFRQSHLMEDFKTTLQRNFRRVEENDAPYQFWVRQEGLR